MESLDQALNEGVDNKKRDEYKHLMPLKETVEEIEEFIPNVETRIEAEAILRKAGVNFSNRNPGEMMLLAAQYGIYSVVKHFCCPQFPLTF